MPYQHKNPPVTCRPPEADRARLLAYAKKKGQPVSRVMSQALAEFLAAHCPQPGQ
jgi:hypothetical protein